MNTMKRETLVTSLFVSSLLMAPAWGLMTTAFTYQGQLKQGGVPADGLYDFHFSLWNDARSTDVRDQIGTTLTLASQSVVNGLFTVKLDFGMDAFPGDARFLDIAVRPRGGLGGYTTLSPRQELTPTPYASTAMHAVGVDGHSLDANDGSPVDAVYVNADGEVGVGTTSPRFPLDVVGTVNATGLRMTTAPTDGFVLTSDAFGNASWQASPAGGDSLWLSNRNDIYYNLGNVGIGTTTPLAMLDVAGPIAVDGFQMGSRVPAGHVLTADASGVGTWQAPPAGGSGFWGDGPEDHIYYNDGRVGIGTGSAQTPAQTLHVEGSGYFRDRLGIGVMAPGKPLDVMGDARVFNGNLHLGAEGFDPYIELMSDENSDALEMRLKSLDGVGFAVTNSTNTPLMVVESTGDVGIGTTAPAYPLHVLSSSGRTIVGESSSAGGRGVHGEVTGTAGYGVAGVAASGTGVLGESNATSGGTGVQGWIESSTGVGVLGLNDASTGDAIAVKGVTQSPEGYGGYFEGKGYFSSDVSASAHTYHTPQERHLSIPGCAFRPSSHSTDFYQYSYGALLGTVIPTPGTYARFDAPVYLPQGAMITQLTAYARHHTDAYPFTVTLSRREYGPTGTNYVEIRTMASIGSGDLIIQDDVDEVVDNGANAYFVSVSNDYWNLFVHLEVVDIAYTVDAAD